jgi:hypothetical protein
MNFAFALFAQLADPGAVTSPVAAWLGTGLLGSVLGWLLLRHLPEKDRQLKEFLTEKDDRMDAQRKEFTASLSAITSAFQHENSLERVAVIAEIKLLLPTVCQAKMTTEFCSNFSQQKAP